MASIGKFIKSSAIYFVGNVLTKVISFFLLPIYTSYIATADMGYYDVSVSYVNIIAPVVCMEIWSGIMRYMFDYNEKDGKYKAIFNGFIIFGCSVLIYTIGAGVLGIITDIKLLFLIFLYGITYMLHTVYSYIVRGLGYNAVFAVSGILGSLINSVSNIIMILFLNMRLESMYIALILGLAFQVIFMEFRIKLIKHLSFDMFDKVMIMSMVRFSLPLCLNSASFWFLSSYNRVGISNTLGLEANGIYSVAAKFTYVLGLASNCFSMAWQEMVYSMGNEKENKSKFYSTASNYYIKFLMYGTVVLIPAVSVIFNFMVAKEYRAAYDVVPLYLLATVTNIYSVFLGNIFSAEKKTGIIFISTVAAAIVNVSLFHLLVGKLELQAANIALLCGFLVIIVLRLILLGKDFKIRLDFKMLIFTTILFCIAYYIYATKSQLVNFIAAIVFGIIALIAFRDLIKKGLNVVKSKLGKNKKIEQ